MVNFSGLINALNQLSEDDKKKLNQIMAIRNEDSNKNYINNMINALKSLEELREKEALETYKAQRLKEIEKERLGKKLLSNTDYIDWVLDYLNTHEVVSNDVYFHYYKDKTPKKDQERIELLDTVYNAVNDYAYKSHISDDDIEAYYDVLYNGVYLRFGAYHNPECNMEIYKISEDEVSEKTLINFEDIMKYYIEYFKNENGDQKKRK